MKGRHTFTDKENLAFLGNDTYFKGELRLDGIVRIDGWLVGKIQVNGTLILGDHAIVKGKIATDTLISSGKIKASVTALERVQLLRPAVLVGEVHAPSLTIEDGAHFHGMCDMGAKQFPWADEAIENPDNVYDLTAHRTEGHAVVGPRR